jgi:hypothetical protein
MAEEKKPSFLDQFLDYSTKGAKVYQTVRLADKGVNSNPTVVYETNGAGDPLIAKGQPAAVTAKDPFAEALKNGTDKLAMAYTAKQASDSVPYIMGMMALGITIYLLTRK